MDYLTRKLIHPVYHRCTQEYGRLSKWMGKHIPLAPLVLRIRATHLCNFHCEFCYQEGFHAKKETSHLSLAEWERILSRLPRWTLIDITGGEPFLAKNFRELLDLILSMGFKTSLITNGSRCDPELLELMVKKQLAYFMISVDGLEEYHNRIRGNPQSFERLSETFRLLDELKKKHRSRFPMTCVKTTLTNDNYTDLVALHGFIFEDLRVENHSLNLMFQNPVRGGGELFDSWNEKFLVGNTARYSEESIPKIVREIHLLLQTAREHGRTVAFKPDIDVERIEDYLKAPAKFGVKKCHKLHSVITLFYDGTLTPCDLGIRLKNVRELDYDLTRLQKQEFFRGFSNTFSEYGQFHPSCDGCCLMPHQPRAERSPH